MSYLLAFVLLLSLLNDTGHPIFTRQALINFIPSSSADLDTSAVVTPMLPLDSFQASASTSPSFGNVPTPLPHPLDSDPFGPKTWQDLNSGFCAVGDKYCSYDGFNKITGNASIAALANQCLLWDASCTGNRTLAMQEFFNAEDGSQNALTNNRCFCNFDSGNSGITIPIVLPAKNAGGAAQPVLMDSGDSSDCKNYNPPERISAWKNIKSWMRSPECVSAQDEWIDIGHSVFERPGESFNITPSCCGGCVVGAENVDLYYWPEPEIDTSCLSIIGNSVNPFNLGATTLGSSPSLETHWACTAKTPVISMIDNIHTTKTTISIITTAIVDYIGWIPVKIPLIDPWASSPCIEVDSGPRGFNGLNVSTKIHSEQASIQARAHTLIIPPSVTEGSGSPVSTVVSGNYTL